MAQSVSMSAAGVSAPLVFRFPPRSNGLLPGIIATVSPGASLTYNIEITGDAVEGASYKSASGNWNVFDGMGSLTASANGTLAAAVTAFRINVTAYSSGSVNLAIVAI
jgi:hypothetical protein